MTKSPESKVGLFALAVLLLAFLGAGLALVRSDVFASQQHYQLKARTGEGLVAGMPLIYSGFQIGRVDSLELMDDGQVAVRLIVLKKHARWVRETSVFSLERPPLGAASIKVTSADLNAPIFSGQRIAEIVNNDKLGELTAKVEPIIASVDRITANLASITAKLDRPTEAADWPVNTLLAQLALLSKKLNDKSLIEVATGSPETVKNLDATLKNVNALTADTHRTLYAPGGMADESAKLLKDINAKMASVDNLLREADATLKNVNKISGDAAGATTDLATARAQVDLALFTANALMQDLRNLIPFKAKPATTLP